MHQRQLTQRIKVICFIFTLIIAALCCKLGYLQLVQGKELAAAAVAERTLKIPLGNFLRGEICDRTGKSLLVTGTNYQVALFPSLLPRSLASKEKLYDLLHSSKPGARFANQLESALGTGSPVLLPMKLNLREAALLIDQAETLYPQGSGRSGLTNNAQALLPGLYLVPLPVRYGTGSLARHLVGLISGEVLNGEVQVGIKGLEAVYNKVLKAPGGMLDLLAEVGRDGKQLKGAGLRLGERQGNLTEGSDLLLTIDRRVQLQVEKVLDRYQVKGAAVVMDVHTGEVLGIASRPNFNQNDGSGDQFDRSLALYHPGSVFKLLVAAAALSEGVVQPGEQFYCGGQYTFPNGSVINCWKQGGHGRINFRQAFADSCNTVFVTVGLRLGSAKLQSYARLLGLENGFATGQLPGWRGGSINIGQYDGEIGNAALGQQGVLLSPVNVAALTATIVRGGIYLAPSIIRGIRQGAELYAPGNKSKQSVQLSAKPAAKRVLSPQVAGEITAMMHLTVSDDGTGQGAAVSGLNCGGKTGTAETGSPDNQSDAWFTGFVTGEGSGDTANRSAIDSGYVITVFAQGGGSGGGIPTQVFHDIAAGLKAEGLFR